MNNPRNRLLCLTGFDFSLQLTNAKTKTKKKGSVLLHSSQLRLRTPEIETHKEWKTKQKGNIVKKKEGFENGNYKLLQR